MILHGTYSISQNLHGLRLAPLKVKALADSKLAVWQREDSAGTCRCDDWIGALMPSWKTIAISARTWEASWLSITSMEPWSKIVRPRATGDATGDAMGCMGMAPWTTMKYSEMPWNHEPKMSLGAPKKSWIQQLANSRHRITALTSVQQNSTQ